ncbi:membrane bound O-acyl transferase family-domain-containing protein [Mycena polygramma]|nr:membrane bound O-acyl transferase family-domain-containing protein [Mycena polygramma]
MWSSLLPDLNHREPLTFGSFFHAFLLPVGLHYVTNALAILGPSTFLYRLALMPVTLFLAYRATVSLDVAKGLLASDTARLEYMNQALVIIMFVLLTRTLYRTFSSQTPRRRKDSAPMTLRQLALEAADLTFNLRGLGWNFSQTMKLPIQTRPVTPTSAYLSATAKSLLLHIIVFDLLHYFSQILGPDTVGSTAGASIYDPSSSNPFIRQLRASTLTLLVGLLIYGAIQIGYDAFALVGVSLLHQSPSQWPPIFDAPWYATSLTEFWAARWHQLFRQDFIAIGGKPLALVAGRPGGVLGAFLVSGTLHFVGLWGMGKGADIRVICFFLMMGVGVVLEGFWRRVAGFRVGGWWGWVWTLFWVLAFAPLMADPWCLSGIMGSVFVPVAIRPSIFLHRLVTSILQSANE